MKRTLYLLLIAISLFGCKEATSQNKNNQRLEVQAMLDSLVSAQDVPGLNFSIVMADGSEEHYSSGMEDIENGIRLKPDRVLFSGSIGKTYAAALLFQLVDEGKISLKDKIIDYFPETEWLNRIPNINDITLEMLLKHTSGLPRWVMDEKVWTVLVDHPDKVWSYRDRFEYIFDTDAIHPAGEGWGYSDTNYLFIGMLIEKIYGSEYYDLVKERILDPIGLMETHPSLRRDIPNLSQAYSKLPELFQTPGKVVEEGKYYFNPQMEWTGGGMASTTADLARWSKAYYGGELFSDTILSLVLADGENMIQLGPKMAYTMASFRFDTPVGISYGHTGFVPGFNSIFAWYPDLKMAVAMQFNSDYAGNRLPLNAYLDMIMALY